MTGISERTLNRVRALMMDYELDTEDDLLTIKVATIYLQGQIDALKGEDVS
jgi:hypothetical protein